MVALVNSWNGSFSNTHNNPPPPGPSSLKVPVANTGSIGNWMFCLVAWRQPPGYLTTVAVGDDGHNFWQPLGAPAAATPASSQIRTAVWYCRTPFPAKNVYVAPTGYCPAFVAEVVEFSGLSPWATMVGISGLAHAAEAVLPPPSGPALVFTLYAYDNHLTTGTPVAGNGWTTLSTVTSSNFTDEANDCELNAAWQVTSGAADGNWQQSGAIPSNTAVLTTGVLVTGITPLAASLSWPYIKAEAAFGAGALTPWDQQVWTDITPRFQSLSPARGKQYDLDQIQSGTGTWKLSNNDGALTPDYEGSPYWLGVSGWLVVTGNGTVEPSLAYDYEGQATAVFTPDGVTSGGHIGSAHGAVVTGLNYYCQAAVLCPMGWPTVKLAVSWFDNTGVFISSSTVQQAAALAGQWLLLSGSVTPPAGTGTASITVTQVGTPYPSIRLWVAAAFLLAPTGSATGTDDAVTLGWMSDAGNIHSCYLVDPATTAAFFNPSTSFISGGTPTTDPRTDSLTGTPILSYTAYAQFRADVTNASYVQNGVTYTPRGPINAVFQWVRYDNESWVQTPTEESADPQTYLANFITLAHAHSLKVMVTPARDLASTDTAHPKLPGETDDGWYLRTNIPAACAGAEILSVQDQANQGTTTEFMSFFNSARTLARAADSTIGVWCGVSVTYGDGSVMYSSAKSVPFADGFWINIIGDTTDSLDFMRRVLAGPLPVAQDAIINSNPFFSLGPRSYTPVRLLVTWPPPPAANARTYVVHRAYMERWPQALTDARYQVANAASVDVWTLTTGQLLTQPRSEILSDGPLAWWPLDDPVGATSGSNKAPTPFAAMQVIQSKYGTGGATQAFGADASFLAGDSGASCWSVTGVTTSTQGYSLYFQDNNLPPLGGPLTVEAWFNLPATQPSNNLNLITIAGPAGTAFQLYVDHTTLNLMAEAFYSVGSPLLVTAATGPFTNGKWFHLTVTYDPVLSLWDVYLNGVFIQGLSGADVQGIGSPWWLSMVGRATPTSVQGMCNASCDGAAVYNLTLPGPRVMTRYLAYTTGNYGNDTVGQRIDRLLGLGSAAFPRCISAGVDTVVGATDIAQQAVGQAVVNVAESAEDLLMVDAPGYIFDQARLDGYNLPVSWVFGEQPATPLNQNWDFELGVSPWVGQNGAALSQSTIWAQSGLHSALWTGNGSTANPQISSEAIAVTPGVSYTITSWLNSPQGWATGMKVSLVWKTSGGTTITTTAGTATPATGNQPVQLSVSARAPWNAATVTAILQATGTPANTVQFLADLAKVTTTATEYAYLPSIATDYDPTQIYNDVQISQLQTPAVAGGEAVGATVAVAKQASIAKYGDRTNQATSYLTDANVIGDQGWWIVNIFGDPANRIAQMVIDPSAYPDLWPVVLGIEVGQVVYVNRRLGGTEPEIRGYFQVMNIGHDITQRSWQTTLILVPYVGNILTCDDVVRGVLDGQNPLGW